MAQWISAALYAAKARALVWIIDDDGAIGITLFGVVTLVKYKHSTIVHIGKRFDRAPKWYGTQGGSE